MHDVHPRTRRLLVASIFATTIALARQAPAQSLPPFPHAVPPADAASIVGFHVDGGPHTITVLPRRSEWDVGSHAVDCTADCTLRLAPGRYVMLVARTPNGPSYSRRIAIRTDSTFVAASSPQSMTPAYVLAGAGVVTAVAGLAVLIAYAGAYPFQFDGAPPAVPPPVPDVRIAYAGLALLGTGIAIGLTGMAVALEFRPRVQVLGGARMSRLQFGASPLAEGGFVTVFGWRL